MRPFAIYCRESEEGSSDLTEQEARGMEWAERNGIEIAEIVAETASGGLMADDRKLGQLIARCESGELGGIIVRDEKRFARDVVAGSVALARIRDSGARLVATWTAFDSENLTPEANLVFNMLMAVGQAELERNRLRRIVGKDNAAERGVWCSAPPVGYDRDEGGRLHPNGDAATVRRIFALRAEGRGFSEIVRELPEVTVTHTRSRRRAEARLTRSGVRRIVMNRAYLGEQRVPNGRKGEPRVISNSHSPLVTVQEWEAANAVRGRAPVHTGLGGETQLKGLVRCGLCGGTMHVLAYGKARDRRTYACTNKGCVSMAVGKVEPAVLHALDLAIAEREQHVAAVIEGDTRYADALIAVEDAQHGLAEYRDNIELQRVLGMRDWTEGLRTRREAVEYARRALREVPRPESLSRQPMTLAEFDLDDRRRFYRRVIAEVRVFPRSASQRLTLRWQGSAEEIPVAPVAPSSGPVPQVEAVA